MEQAPTSMSAERTRCVGLVFHTLVSMAVLTGWASHYFDLERALRLVVLLYYCLALQGNTDSLQESSQGGPSMI